MGVRTFVNTIETLANPAGASVHLGSFYHLAFAKKVVDTFVESEFHDLDRVLMFQGMEGYDDVRPGYTKVAEWDAAGGADGADGDAGSEGASFDDFEIETAEYGMDLEEADLAVDDVAVESAEITEAVLTGERDGPFADAVAVNAALRIYAREDADSIEEGLDAAREVIDDGSAHEVLEALRHF
jgi:anthranilate phosphoribosyltransferase